MKIDWEQRRYSLACALLMEEIKIADIKRYPANRESQTWNTQVSAAIDDALLTADAFLARYRSIYDDLEGDQYG